jgi:hypothetical protein
MSPQPYGSLQFSQQPITEPWRHPNKLSPHLLTASYDRCYTNLPSHACVSSGLFPSEFPIQILYVFFISPMRAAKGDQLKYFLMAVIPLCNQRTTNNQLNHRLTQLFFVARQPLVGQGLLNVEASRSHPDTPHLVGLLWTSDQSVAETST